MAIHKHSSEVVLLNNDCSICTVSFKEPARLLCGHVFCLQCIQRYVDGSKTAGKRRSSQKLSCPLCRTEFIVPVDGLKTLVITLETENIITCDICTSNTASWTCIDCEQNLCSQDLNCHSRLKSTKDHTVFPIHDSRVDQDRRKNSLHCDVHQEKKIELYCKQCDTALCVTCFVVQHVDHKPIMTQEDAAKEYQEQMQTFIDTVDQQLADCFQEHSALEENKKAFMGNVEDVQQQIFHKIDGIKRRLDDYKNDFLIELDVLKSSELNTLQTAKEDVETRLLSLDSFKETLQAAKSATQPIEIIRVTEEYRSKMAEWVETGITTYTVSTILFSSSVGYTTSTSDRSNVVGTLISIDTDKKDDDDTPAPLTQPAMEKPQDVHLPHASQSTPETCPTYSMFYGVKYF